MKIRSITPIVVGPAEVARRQARYDRLSPPGVEIVLEDLPADLDPPRQLGNAQQIRHSEEIGFELASATDAAAFDAVMPDCVLDPAVGRLDAHCDVTVLGITRIVAHMLAALGQRFGVITRNEAIGEEFRRVVESYGLSHVFDDVYVLDLSVEDIADDAKWNAAVTVAAGKAREKGVRTLINGCSAVEVTLEQEVRIVDPTALALKAIGFGIDSGLLAPGRRA